MSQTDSLYEIGDTHYYKSEYVQAIEYYNKIYAIYDSLQDPAGRSKMLNDIALCYKHLGQYDTSKTLFDRSLQIELVRQDSSAIIGRLRNLGQLLMNAGYFSQSLESFHQAFEFLDEKDLKGKARFFNDLGMLAAAQDNFSSSLSNFLEAYEWYIEIGDKRRQAIALNNIGMAYQGMGKLDSALLDSALYYYSEAYWINVTNHDSTALGFNLANIGILYAEKGIFDSAEHYLNSAFEVRSKINNERGIAFTANELAEVYLRQDKAAIAGPFLELAYQYAIRQDNRSILMKSLMLQSRYFKQKNKYKEALNSMEKWSVMRDSSFNLEKLRVLELQSKYELDKKEGERVLEATRADIALSTATERLLLIWVFLFAFIVASLFSIIVFIQRKKIGSLNDELKLLNEDMFHRKRNDYSRVLNELELLEFHGRESVSNMLFASAAVDSLLRSGTSRNIQTEIYFNEYLNDISESLGLKLKSINLRIEVDSFLLPGDKACRVAYILGELLTNSFKHSFPSDNSNPMQMEVIIRKEKKNALIAFQDNGLPYNTPLLDSNNLGQKILSNFLLLLNSELNRSNLNYGNKVTFSFKI